MIPCTLNDMWTFDTQTFEWKWWNGFDSLEPGGDYGSYQVPAASNYPQGQAGFCNWIDKFGNFWFWGGIGLINDLWRFVPDCTCTNGRFPSAAAHEIPII